MTENELDKYLQKRCSEPVFETPDFDSFFTEKELEAALGKSSSRVVPIRKLWPWMATAAAAIAAALIWLTPAGRNQEAQDDVMAYQEQTEVFLEDNSKTEIMEEPDLLTEADVNASQNKVVRQVSRSGNIPATASVISDNTVVSQNTESVQIESAMMTEKSEGADQDSPSPVSEEMESHQVTEPLTYSSRTVEEAYAEAREQRKNASKKHLQGATYSLAVNQDNSFRQGTPNAQSPVSMITRTYASGMGLRSASVSRNEWLQPSIFESQIVEYKPVYDLPIVLSFSTSIPISRCLDIHTGLTYSFLSANTQGSLENGSPFSIDQSLHYLGIPLSLALNVLDRPRFGFYVAAGGGLEKGLLGTQSIQVKNRTGEVDYERLHQPVHGIQPYLSAQIGLSYAVTDMMQFFIEPSISYYLEADQPLSVRTYRPFYYGLGFGVRLCTF